MYRPTDRFENWFITSLQTDVNDTTTSFRLNKALNVNQCRLVIDPYDETKREIVKVTSVDGNLVYVERGDDNTAPEYHNEGTIVALHVIAADLNDLYADWAAKLNDLEATAFLAAHPVNSIYLTVDPTNPSTIYGGTWVAWGSGRVPVGVDATQTEFNTVEKTGGAKTHTLTVAEMPSHNHTHRQWIFNGASSSGAHYGFGYQNNTGSGFDKTEATSSGEVQFGNLPSGGGGAHNNLQPYITCYMWKRTA